MSHSPITTLFLDVGGVLLTNGWDRKCRMRAAEHFKLDYDDMTDRHNLTFGTYEEGKLTLDEYLHRTVFHTERSFSPWQFKQFMYAQSQPLPHMMDYIRALKAKHSLKVAVVSNEGRELTMHRLAMFPLREFVDFFVFSCFVHYRKPDADIWQVALDVSLVPSHQVAYLDDRKMFAEVASGLGIRGIHHTSYESSKQALEDLGLPL